MMLLTVCSCGHKKEKDANTTPNIDVAQAYTDSVVIHKKFPGVVSSGHNVEVVAQSDGRILRKCFTDGDYVRKGAVLYQLDPKIYQSNVAEAEAALAKAKGQYDYYTTQTAAMKKALEADAVAAITVEQAESNLRVAKASLAAAQAQLASARTSLEYCRVTAPISGRTQSGVQEGEYASQGRTLVNIVDNSDLKVTFSIDESRYRQLAAEGLADGESSVMFRNVPVEFEGAGTFPADLYYVSPSVDVATGTVTLEGKLQDPRKLLSDGMYASVNLPVSTDPKAILVKDASIGTDLQGEYVYLVDKEDKVVYTPVKTGETVNDTLRIITSGVKPGNRYVVSALLTVRNGEKVKPVIKK